MKSRDSRMTGGGSVQAPFPEAGWFETLRGAVAIPGARSTTMEDIGHFPMAENYPLFRQYLLPILRDIVPEEGA